MIIKSLLTGYVLTLCYHIVPSVTNNTEYMDIMVFLILCVLSSYFIARFYKSTSIRKICKKLKISTTVNEYIWDDIGDRNNKPLWIRAIQRDNNTDIIGQLVLIEEYQRKPMIVLARYERKNLDGETKEDCSSDITQRVLIDTEKCDRIELIYDINSMNIR